MPKSGVRPLSNGESGSGLHRAWRPVSYALAESRLILHELSRLSDFDAPEVLGSSHVLKLGVVHPDDESRGCDMSNSLILSKIHVVVALV